MIYLCYLRSDRLKDQTNTTQIPRWAFFRCLWADIIQKTRGGKRGKEGKRREKRGGEKTSMSWMYWHFFRCSCGARHLKKWVKPVAWERPFKKLLFNFCAWPSRHKYKMLCVPYFWSGAFEWPNYYLGIRSICYRIHFSAVCVIWQLVSLIWLSCL